MTSGLRFTLALLLLGAGVARADVVTALSGSHLRITGDDSPDAIAITPGDQGGVTVTGFDGTLVDGSSDAITFFGVRSVTVRLMHGADHVAVAWLGFRGTLDIGMGKGNDTVDLDEVVGGTLKIATSQGYDVVNLFGPSYFDWARIRTGSGSDLITVDGVAVGSDLYVVAGRDDDDVVLEGIEIYDDVDVHLSDGDDVLWFGYAEVWDDTDLDGDGGDNWLDLYGYVDLWGDVDFDDFEDDDWWWWY